MLDAHAPLRLTRVLRFVRLAAALFSLALFGGRPVWAQSSAPGDDVNFDAYVRSAMDAWGVPGVAIATVRDGAIVSVKGYGVRTEGKPAQVTGDTVFAIASLTKGFTAATLAQLVDEKKITWDDPVVQYLPTLKLYDPKVTEQTTIRDVLAQRTCLEPKDLFTWDSPFDRDETLRRLQFLKPVCTFRDQFVYNNLNYVIAGEVAAKASGMPWPRLVESRILAPLGMTNSTARTAVAAKGKNVATPHIRTGGKLRALPLYDEGVSAAAGSIHASAADMARWLEVQLGEGTFRTKTIWSRGVHAAMHNAQMATPAGPVEAGDPPTPSSLGYGFGWGPGEYRGRRFTEHTGQSDGMYALIAMMPNEKLGIVVLTNTSMAGLTQAIAYRWLDQNLGAPAFDWAATMYALTSGGNDAIDLDNSTKGLPRKLGTKPSLPLAAYAGRYRNDLLGDAVVAVERNNGLSIRVLAHKGVLTHWEDDTFAVDWGGNPYYTLVAPTLSFKADAGKASALELGGARDVFVAVREGAQ